MGRNWSVMLDYDATVETEFAAKDSEIEKGKKTWVPMEPPL